MMIQKLAADFGNEKFNRNADEWNAAYQGFLAGYELGSQNSGKPFVSGAQSAEQLAAFIRWYWDNVDGKPCDTTAEDIVAAYGG